MNKLAVTTLALILCLASAAGAAAAKPNIIYIITDDQDIKLSSLHVQPNVKALLIDQGVFFENAYVTTPVCCPSRSSILTGKYVHNHHTYENAVGSGCDGQSWRDRNEQKTIGAYISKAGYKTGFFGKYLNNYALPGSGVGVSHIPPGWDRWYTLVGNSKFYHYSVSNQGVAEKHGDDYTKDYFTDRVRDQAVQFIKDSVKGDKPFFAYISTPAPHRPATPAPQYATMFSQETAPRTPSYGFHGADKHWIISEGTPALDENTTKIVDDLYRDRIRTLVSVDDLVKEVVGTLKDENVLDNTYILYNSDHGYHLGEFNQQGEKRQPYDENIRVPFIVRGPGVPQSKNATSVALNIDMAPTILDLAGATVPDDMDGISLKSSIMSPQATMDAGTYHFMLEYYGEGGREGCMGSLGFLHDCHNNTWLALRGADSTSDYMYAQFYKTDTFPIDVSDMYFKEYYDLNKDFWEKENIVKTLSDDQVKKLEDTITKWYKCSGKTCQEGRKNSIL